MGNYTADQIETIVKDLIALKSQGHDIQSVNKMESFKEFRLSNRMFYEMILTEENIHQNPIYKQMLKMKRRLESGEDQYSVDVKFGQYMAEKYIDPVINKK
jgi:hypothetical protein